MSIRGFPGKLESSNVSRGNLSREIVDTLPPCPYIYIYIYIYMYMYVCMYVGR